MHNLFSKLYEYVFEPLQSPESEIPDPFNKLFE